jgi:hypothetical protein
LGIPLLAALITLNGIAYLGNNLPERKEDYRAAAGLVASQAAPGDIVLFAPPVIEAPFAYYDLGQEGGSAGLPVDRLKDGVISMDPGLEDRSPLEALDRSHRVWLVTTSNIYLQDQTGLESAVAAQGQLAGQWQVVGLTVRRYDLDP